MPATSLRALRSADEGRHANTSIRPGLGAAKGRTQSRCLRFSTGRASDRLPTLDDPRLREAAQAIADTIPAAQHRELAGQTHNVKPDVLAPAVVEFFTEPTATTSSRT
jgi:hypothetical protein